VNTIGGLIGSVKESEIFHFGLLYFCMHSTILKLQIAISMVCNCSLDETILELIKQVIYVCGVGSNHKWATYVLSVSLF
jgi:hypothetical protein